jgi:zinc transporter ZupT
MENRLRTALRLLVLGAFCGVVAVILVLIGVVVLSLTGLSFDPHGYGVFAGILVAAVLTPVALVLGTVYRSLR